MGPTGETGPDGPTGPTGADAEVVSTINALLSSAEFNKTTPGPPSDNNYPGSHPFVFDKIYAVSNGIANDAATTMTVLLDGDYDICYRVSGVTFDQDVTLSIYFSMSERIETAVHIPGHTEMDASTSVIASLGDGTTITLQIHSDQPVNYAGASAFMTAQRLA
jgi:hypothetical protein